MKRRRQQQITMRADAGGGFRFGFGFESVTAGRNREEPETSWKLGGGGAFSVAAKTTRRLSNRGAVFHNRRW